MTVQIRGFVFEITSSTVFVRLPYIGQCIFGRSVGPCGEWLVIDSWVEIKQEGPKRDKIPA